MSQPKGPFGTGCPEQSGAAQLCKQGIEDGELMGSGPRVGSGLLMSSGNFFQPSGVPKHETRAPVPGGMPTEWAPDLK